MKVNKKFFTFFLAIALASVFFVPIAPCQEKPEAVVIVEGLHSLLIKSMKKGKETTCKERYDSLYKYIKNAFDFPTISRLVLGRKNWKKMDELEKKEFITAFMEMTVATYASRFDSYSGEKFKTKGFKKNRKGHFIINTVLIKKDKEEIDFKYLLRRVKDHWKIVSVSAKGVNDLSVKRADYNSFLKNHSIKELIKKIKEKASSCFNEK